MLSNLTLTMCCLVLGAPPAPVVSPAGWNSIPVPSGVQADWQSYSSDDSELRGDSPFAVGDGSPYCADCNHCNRRHGSLARPLCDWLCSPCDMSQRYPYYPKDHGNYYFRPYHMHRVDLQREIAASWGEDPRNPYAHSVFDRVYEQLRAEQPEELPPGAEPGPLKPMGSAVPTPPLPAPPLPAPPAPEPEEEASELQAPAGRRANPLRPIAIETARR